VSDDPQYSFLAESGFGQRTQQPFVQLSYNGTLPVQMPVEDAIALAHNLLAAAEAAIGDAYMITFLRDNIGLEMEQIAGLIHEFRQWRDKRDEEPAR
jgi:hypothetical protein